MARMAERLLDSRRQRRLVVAQRPEVVLDDDCPGSHAIVRATKVDNHGEAAVHEVVMALYGRTAEGPCQLIGEVTNYAALGPGKRWSVDWDQHWAAYGLPVLLPEEDGTYAVRLVAEWAMVPGGMRWRREPGGQIRRASRRGLSRRLAVPG